MSTAALLPLAAESLDSTVRIVAIITTALMLGVVLELVRRRRLVERYALLWLVVAAVLLLFAVWTDLLEWASDRVGIVAPANFLFLAGMAFAFLLLLHFSVATSRLSEEAKILAQEVARLDAELRAERANGGGPEAAAERLGAVRSGPAADLSEAQQAEHPSPVDPEQHTD